jgi:hypothetical protein
MPVFFDPRLTEDQKKLAQAVVEELEIGNFRITMKGDEFHFIQDRRIVHVPERLIKEGLWADIRFLFRAILGSSPSFWNLSAENTWGPAGPDYSKRKA